MHKKISGLTQLVATGAFVFSLFASAAPAMAYTSLSAGDLIKLPDDGNSSTNVDSAIYYYGADGFRYVFPNSKTYFTWYNNFSNVKVVTATQMGTIGIGGNVTYRPGVKMIKIESDPKVYAIDRGGARRWVANETSARTLYGSDWNRKIDDVPDGFFSNYPLGDDINSASDFTPSSATNLSTSIAADKQLSPPIEVTINSDGTLSPATVSVTLGRTVRWTNSTGGEARVNSDLAGLDSAYVPAGLNYVYRFRQAGTWTVRNHADQSKTMTITVQ